MSAIAGIVHLDGRPVEGGLIQRMTACMAYRGPDGIDHWQQDGVALGHALLRTTPQSLHEVQPLFDPVSRLAIVMDGRLDNRPELLAALDKLAAPPLNASDSALVLRAFELWGRDCARRLDGDFAFAIWDGKTRELHCVRDRIGTRAFYYAQVGDTLLFASDVRAIWHSPLFKPVFNEDMVCEYLAGEWLHHDQTFWQGLHRLMPAQWMTVSARGREQHCYWSPDPFAKLPCKTDQDYEAYYRWLLADIVQSMSDSHLPLAFEVSGGLDSSALFAVAADLQKQARLRAPGMQGYTYDFSQIAEADELHYVRDLEQFCGHKVKPVLAQRVELDWYRRFATDFKIAPGFPNTVMGLSLYRQAVQDGSRVVIGGLGGDEWLGGWDRGYAEALLAHDWAGVAACWKEDCESQAWPSAAKRLLRLGLMTQLPEAIKRPLRLVFRRGHYLGFDKECWLAPAQKSQLQSRKQKFAMQHLPTYARLSQCYQFAVLHDPWIQYIQDIEDIQCGLMGVEWRRPLADRRMIEFAFATPERLRSNGQFDRVLHRKVMQGVLPPSIVQRRVKADFMSTFDIQLAREIGQQDQPDATKWLRKGGLQAMRELAEQDAASQFERYGGWPHTHLWSFFGVSTLSSQG